MVGIELAAETLQPWSAAALLGTSKTGAAFLLIEPTLPVGRLEQMRAGCDIVLSDAGVRSTAGTASTPIAWEIPPAPASAGAAPIAVADGEGSNADGAAAAAGARGPTAAGATNPIEAGAVVAAAVTGDDDPIACIVYTSGSTGVPKAVQLQHSAMRARLEWQWETLPYKPVTTLSSPLCRPDRAQEHPHQPIRVLSRRRPVSFMLTCAR